MVLATAGEEPSYNSFGRGRRSLKIFLMIENWALGKMFIGVLK